MAPTKLPTHDFRVWIGGSPDHPSKSIEPCTQPYHARVFNISALSFGSLSSNAILALNKGDKLGGFVHDTGEGSISAHHRTHGDDLIWEIGSGYFGCRNDDGSFSEERFAANANDPQVKLIELKMSARAPNPATAASCPTPRSPPRLPPRGVCLSVRTAFPRRVMARFQPRSK